jgi:ankyrin repeat protein
MAKVELSFVVNKTAGSDHKIKERLECIRLLFQAGARLDSTSTPGESPIHMAVAEAGNAPLLRLLLEHGADANALQPYAKRSILFEAVGSYQQPDATVRVLLEFGADPNATALFDDEKGPVTPLLRAAELGRWGLCATLIEKGANPDFKTTDGTTLRKMFQEAEADFSPDGYTTQEDFERLKKMMNR